VEEKMHNFLAQKLKHRFMTQCADESQNTHCFVNNIRPGSSVQTTKVNFDENPASV